MLNSLKNSVPWRTIQRSSVESAVAIFEHNFRSTHTFLKSEHVSSVEYVQGTSAIKVSMLGGQKHGLVFDSPDEARDCCNRLRLVLET